MIIFIPIFDRPVSLSLEKIPKNGIDGSWSRCHFTLIKICHVIYITAKHFISSPIMYERPKLHLILDKT